MKETLKNNKQITMNTDAVHRNKSVTIAKSFYRYHVKEELVQAGCGPNPRLCSRKLNDGELVMKSKKMQKEQQLK